MTLNKGDRYRTQKFSNMHLIEDYKVGWRSTNSEITIVVSNSSKQRSALALRFLLVHLISVAF